MPDHLAAAPPRTGAPGKWPCFIVVAVGVFMSTMDSSMVNIALPSIMADFHSPLRSTEWVVMIYLLTITATLLCWGTLADRLGKGRVYGSGLLFFGIGSFACATAPALGWLIAARLLQALGAAMMMATGPALIKEAFPDNQLGRGLGLIGISVSLGLMTGPSLGGLLLHLFSWRALFLVTVPVALVFSILARRVLPRAAAKGIAPRFDWSGAAVWGLALTVVALALTQAAAPSRSVLLLIVLAGFGTGLTGLFVRLETRVDHPLLPIQLFRQRYFSTALATAALSFMVLFTAIMLTPFYLDRVLTLSSARIGLIMMAIPLAAMVVAPLAGWLSDHIGARILSTLGLTLSTAGLLLLTGLTADSRPLAVALCLSLLGCGQAMFLSPNSASLLGRVGQRLAGTAAALLATARNLGMLLGIALAGLVFSVVFSRLTGGLDMRDFSLGHTAAFMGAYRGALRAAACFGGLGALLSWLRESPGREPAPDPMPSGR